MLTLKSFWTLTGGSMGSILDDCYDSEAIARQVGGDHYKKKKIQPIDFVLQNNLGFAEGNVIKYVTRHKEKNGADDIRKAIHYLEFILRYEYPE